MMDGFDLDSALVCEGLIGDGCGGGRIFFMLDTKLFVYDPTTKERSFLIEVDSLVSRISKNACIITLITESKIYKFDLSELKIIDS